MNAPIDTFRNVTRSLESLPKYKKEDISIMFDTENEIRLEIGSKLLFVSVDDLDILYGFLKEIYGDN